MSFLLGSRMARPHASTPWGTPPGHASGNEAVLPLGVQEEADAVDGEVRGAEVPQDDGVEEKLQSRPCRRTR